MCFANPETGGSTVPTEKTGEHRNDCQNMNCRNPVLSLKTHVSGFCAMRYITDEDGFFKILPPLSRERKSFALPRKQHATTTSSWYSVVKNSSSGRRLLPPCSTHPPLQNNITLITQLYFFQQKNSIYLVSDYYKNIA